MHKSAYFTFALLAFILAVILGLLLPHSSNIFLYTAFLLIIISFLIKDSRRFFWLSVIVICFLLGLFRTGWERKIDNQNQVSQNKTLSGIVITEPKVSGKYQTFLLKKQNRDILVRVTTNQFPKYSFGEKIKVTGNFNRADQPDNNRNIYGNIFLPQIEKDDFNEGGIRDSLLALRVTLNKQKRAFEKQIAIILPEPISGLLAGILLGTRSQLTSEIITLLTITGTVHIIALSGYNITIIIDFFKKATGGFSKNLAFWLPTIGICIFVLATGASASIVRAAIMGWVLLCSKYFGRQNDSSIAIILSASIMIFFSPNIILYDIGFQLSFAAILGIVYFSESIEKKVVFLGKTLGNILGATVAANLTTWPILSYHFGRVSLISPVSNLLILPFIPPLMFIGFLATTVSFVSLWLGEYLAVICWFIVEYMLKVITLLAGLKFSQITLKIGSPLFLIGYAFLLFDLTLFIRRPIVKR